MFTKLSWLLFAICAMRFSSSEGDESWVQLAPSSNISQFYDGEIIPGEKFFFSNGDPGSRFESSSFHVKERYYVGFGGSKGIGTHFHTVYHSDIWEFFLGQGKGWRWLHGEGQLNNLNEVSDFSTFHIDNQPGARYGAISFTSNFEHSGMESGSLILMGGGQRIAYKDNMTKLFITFNDVWEFSPDYLSWRIIKNSTYLKHVNESDLSQTMTYGSLGDFHEENEIPPRMFSCHVQKNAHFGFIFGGSLRFLGTPWVPLNDLWEYSIQYNEFALLSKYSHTHGDEYINATNGENFLHPLPRDGAYCWIANDKFVVYSGRTTGGISSDMWTWNITEKSWNSKVDFDWDRTNKYVTKSFNPGNIPSSRLGGCYFTVQQSDVHYFVLFGGFGLTDVVNDYQFLSDMWIFDNELEIWNYENKTKVIGVLGPSCVKDDYNNLHVFGGSAQLGVSRGYYLHTGFQSDCPPHSRRTDLAIPYQVNGTWVNFTCECYEGYFGDSCKFHDCYNVTFNKGSVCSGNGLCLFPDHCQCDHHYFLNDCSDWICYKHKKELIGTVCNGKGICKSADNCICDDDYYGQECYEYIYDAQYSSYDNIIYVGFEAPRNFIPGFISCSEIVHNKKILGNNPTCRFEIDGEKSTYLVIQASRNNSVYLDEYIGIIPLSRDEYEVVWLQMKMWIPSGPNALDIVMIVLVVLLVSVIFVLIVSFVAVIMYTLLIQNQIKKKKMEIEEYFEMEEVERGGSDASKHFKINKNLMEIKYEDLKIIKRIGKGGGQATIFLCHWQEKDVAFKCFRISDLSGENDFKEFEKEAELLASLRHPSLIKFYGTCLRKARVGIVIQYCERGSIDNYIKNHAVPFEDKLRLMHECAIGIAFLHSKDIIHRDIKNDNLLIDSAGKIRIIDFGLSKLFKKEGKGSKGSDDMTQKVGTSIYMAPEVVKNSTYTAKCDIFSLSIVFFQIVFENWKPYGENVKTFNIEYRVALDNTFRPSFKNIGPLYKDGGNRTWFPKLIRKMWDGNVDIRPSAEELCKIIESKRNDLKRKGKDIPKLVIERKKKPPMSLNVMSNRLSKRFDLKNIFKKKKRERGRSPLILEKELKPFDLEDEKKEVESIAKELDKKEEVKLKEEKQHKTDTNVEEKSDINEKNEIKEEEDVIVVKEEE